MPPCKQRILFTPPRNPLPPLSLLGLAPGRKAGGFFFMTREKRSSRLQTHVFPSTRERLERVVAEQGNVISLSDYLFELVERELTVIEISKQKIGRRIGRN